MRPQADAILSTNTSGIPLRQISEGFPPNSAEHFLGTHFFNPPRYLHLME
jgi:3-hydroxyacyl-CoA dehydrogenase